MKFVTIADTHGKHDQLALPARDVLIHAGDLSRRGDRYEVKSFLDWFKRQDYTHKIFIAGNHDFYFEKESAETIYNNIPENVIYLNDSAVTIEGINIWGSPITPFFYNWAFNRRRGEEIKKHWDMIPNGTDIVITHGPVFRALDITTAGDHAGCKDLFNRIAEIKPKIHICGHIHEAYGSVVKSGIQYINASVVNSKYDLINQPITFEI